MSASVLSLVNAFVHSRDGYTAVVPTGLILSATVLLILLIARLYHRPGTGRPYPSGREAPAYRRAGAVMAACLMVFCCAVGSAYGLSGSFNTDVDPASQIGANPALPLPHQYLVPPMRIAPVTQWGKGEAPTVAAGLQAQPFATGLAHPRSLYVLPNGDVLVAETSGPSAPVNRPKDVIMGWVKAYAGAGAKGGNRITLLRDTKGDGVPDMRTVFSTT